MLKHILLIFILLGLCVGAAAGKTIRFVSYNIDCADQGSDNNLTNTSLSLPTAVKAIGLHHLGTNTQPVDLLGVEELKASTLGNFTNQLNLIYGAGTYAYDSTTDLTTGGGTDGLIYNTHTVQVIAARTMKIGQNVFLQSNGVYVAAAASSPSTYASNGVTRAPLVYQVRPIGFGTNYDLFLYVSHARASDNTAGDARYAEAQAVRSDAKYNLPASAHIIYSGDWNLFNGSGENAYKCLTGQITTDGIDWSDTSVIWGNPNQTQACDPMSPTVPPTIVNWANAASDNATWLYGDSTSSITTQNSSRLDIQLMNRPMFAAYNTNGGVQIAPCLSSPFDSANFPSARYPYAFETFGNNGSLPRLAAITNAANHSLDDLTNTVPNAATVYADILLTGSAATFTGSDHYPIVGDYNLVLPPPPALTSAASVTGGKFKFTVPGTAGYNYAVEVTTNLIPANWQALITNTAPYTFTNPAPPGNYFYRVRLVP